MNNNLFFLCCSLAVLIISAVIICVAPIINGVDTIANIMNGWGNLNCKYRKDEYDYNKDHSSWSEVTKKIEKRKVDDCYRKNAMHDLEYTAFIMDVTFGFICSILGLLHYFEVGKSIQKYTGLIGTIAGAIILIITIIYVGYSANIFDNDYVRNPLSGALIYPKLYSNGAKYKLKDNKYVPNYDTEKYSDDTEIDHIKYKDLGKRQYNYNTKFYKSVNDDNSELNKCLYRSFDPSDNSHVTYYKDTKKCDYIWTSNSQTSYIDNKYLYDRWLTTIILGVFDAVCGIGVAIFGVLLFLNGDSSSSGHVPVK